MKLLYIEINNTSLILHIIKEKKDSYLIQNSQLTNLDNLEFKDGIIYNPSKISSIVKEFLKTNKFKNAKAIICIPDIENNQETKQKLILLQNALCFSNAGLEIKKIISKPIFENKENSDTCKTSQVKSQQNLYSHFISKNKHPGIWIFCSLVFFVLIFHATFNLSTTQRTQINRIESKNNLISKTNLDLTKELSSLNDLKNTNNEFINRIEKLKNFKNAKNNISNLLIHTAFSMPKQSFLTKLSIKKDVILKESNLKSKEQNNQEKINNICLNLAGVTTSQETITQICNKLKTSSFIQSVKPINLKKLKIKKSATNQPKEFAFEVSAIVKKATKTI